MTTQKRHLIACKAYKEAFVDEHSYGYCEHCGRSDLGLQTHHIVFASRAPKHESLHDHRNLILLCTDCHRKFHSGFKEETEILMEERGLNDLFGCGYND